MSWNTTRIGDLAAYRRASARRHLNSMRRFRRDLRRQQLVPLVQKYGLSRGNQAVIAARLGVSMRTLQRDLLALFGGPTYCPHCKQRIAWLPEVRK